MLDQRDEVADVIEDSEVLDAIEAVLYDHKLVMGGNWRDALKFEICATLDDFVAIVAA